ncbi:MAG TPA: carboxypeptidase-like regulatory domain-containing protein [Bacteroidales bacterium]|nr:carboxypeptidase-like regulatory domain-containing protein [Bacteroidales bacterium]
MKYFAFILLLFLFVDIQLIAQDKKLIQLTGRVTDELLQPMPFAHILVLESYRGAITNTYGNFSLVVEENDSVLISSVGYKRRYMVIPGNLPTNFLTIEVVLQIDTLVIAEAQIYPWKTYEEFKEAFVNLKLPNDNMEIARRNIALIRTQIIMDHEPSARANFRHIMEQQYQQTFTQGQFPSYQILNPFAWAKFFKALKRGDFKSRE